MTDERDDEQRAWDDAFHGDGPAPEAPRDEQPAAESSTSVDERDGLVEAVDHSRVPTAPSAPSVEPTVIAPSTLRGPSHDTGPQEAVTGDVHEPARMQPEATEPTEPPALVEPQRPTLGLRRQPDDTDVVASDAVERHAAERAAERDAVREQPVDERDGAAATIPAASVAAAAATGAALANDGREPVVDEPAQTQAFTRDEIAAASTTRASSIPVDDETARQAAAGGTPIVLVEAPQPPKRKGARGVGFAVALLATIVFAAVFAAAFFAAGYLFDRQFNAQAMVQSLWLRPSWLVPVIVFFFAYWLVTLVVNRAGWWAHVLSGFLVALLVYAAHIAGAFMEDRGGWSGIAAVPGIDPQQLGQLILAPLSVLAFVIAREVPVWVGGIVARRGRRAKEYNRTALEDFERDNAERIAAYERAQG